MKEQSAQLKVWMECPRCGRINKLTREFRLPVREASPRVERVAGPCELCVRDPRSWSSNGPLQLSTDPLMSRRQSPEGFPLDFP
jgi:hypothetical protein